MTSAAQVTVETEENGDPRRWWIMLVLGSVAFMAQLDMFIVNVAVPTLQSAFAGSGLAAVSWVLNAYSIIFAALMVPGGRLADHLGRRGTMLISVGVFVAGSVLCAAAPTLPLLVAGRVVQAVGAAVIVPTSMSLLMPAFPPRRHAVVIGVWAAVASVAASSGPVLGGLLLQAGWRWIFLVNLPIGTTTILLGLWCLPRVGRLSGNRLPTFAGSLPLPTAVTLLILATVQGPSWGWHSPRILALIAGAVAAGAAAAVSATRSPRPLVEARLFRDREFASAAATLVVFMAMLATWLLVTALFLQGVWHYSVLRTGLAMAPGPLGTALVAVNAGRITARFGRTWPPALGLATFGAGALWWILTVPARPDYLTYLPPLVIAGLACGMVQAPLLASVSSLPAVRVATGSAVLNMARQIGAAAGVAASVSLLGGSSLPHTLTPVHRGWLFLALGSFTGAALLPSLRRGRTGNPRGPAPARSAEFTRPDHTTSPHRVHDQTAR